LIKYHLGTLKLIFQGITFIILRVLMYRIFLLLALTGIFSFYKVYPQPVCSVLATSNCEEVTPGGSSQFIQIPISNNVDFAFDQMSKYISGITYSGSTIFKLKIEEKALPVNPCQWKLVMYVDNNGALPDKWETVHTYGASGTVPNIDLIKVKVYNACGTPGLLVNGIYRAFSNTSTVLTIIDEAALVPAGTCTGTHVNSKGSYTTNYGEFTFIIDYRIIPSFSLDLKPGNYQLQLKFCLEEE
jgi:hypothetical protein